MAVERDYVPPYVAGGRIRYEDGIRRFPIRAWRSCALMLLGAFLASPPAKAATPLPPATTFVEANATCPTGIDGCLHLGTSDAFDLSFPDGFIASSGATASPAGPFAEVVGEQHSGTSGDHGVASVLAASEVLWEVRIVPIGPGIGLIVPPVPVHVVFNLGANAAGEAFAEASGGASSLGGVSFCAGNGCNPVGNVGGIRSVSGTVAPNATLDLSVLAEGVAREDTTFSASADPIFSIDDALIPGTDINFRDAFAVVLSPDVTQTLGTPAGTPSVPEPATWAMMALGFLGLGYAAYRRPWRQSVSALQ